MDKLFTICIPAYNGASTISECMDSLTDNRYVEYLDVIVVDNCSNDATLAIVGVYEELFSDCIRVISRNKRDIGGAYNIAIQNGRGRYLMILDQDDYLDRDSFCNLIHKEIYDNGSDILAFNRVELRGEKRKVVPSQMRSEDVIVSNFQESYSHIELFIHNLAFSMQLLKNNNVYADESYIQYADAAFICRAVCFVDKCSILCDSVYVYRISDSQGLSLSGARRFGSDLIECAVSLQNLLEWSGSILDKDDCRQKIIYSFYKKTVCGAYRAALISESVETRIAYLNRYAVRNIDWKSMPLHIRIIRQNKVVTNRVLGLMYVLAKNILKIRV